MRYCIIIPAHNEAEFLPQLLESICNQSKQPQEVVLVNDNSTDQTESIMQAYANKYPYIEYVNRASSQAHLPGGKIVEAFNFGFQQLKNTFDVIVKLDADLILPNNYFYDLSRVFENPKIGIAGGFIYEQTAVGEWERNHPMKESHVRGAIKAYSRNCFEAIGGLRTAMGWDTVDELLALYHGFNVKTIPTLKVKHLRPTGKKYQSNAAILQGKAFYQMRYGIILTKLAGIKVTLQKRSLFWIYGVLIGYFSAFINRAPFIVNSAEGRFIRNFRWRQIGSKS